MTTERKINITIGINGRKYPARISSLEEEVYRKAAKAVDVKYRTYKDKHGNLIDAEGCMAMAAFQFALEKLKLEQLQDVSPFIAEVEKLNDELSDFLSDD